MAENLAEEYADSMMGTVHHMLQHASGEECSEADCGYGEDLWGWLDVLEVSTLTDPTGHHGAHLSIALTLGGPNAFLRRDFGEDRLEVFWGSDVARRYRGEVSELLDRFAECLEG